MLKKLAWSALALLLVLVAVLAINTLRKGSLARIVEYEAEAGRYRIESEV